MVLNSYNFSRKSLSTQMTEFFLHCLDSRIEANGEWYSRFHLGPFMRSSRLQIGTRLRRSIINDLRCTSIIAIKVDGAQHEFSRLSGVYENLLDLLFQFRKIMIYSSFLKLGETIIIPFLFFGSGTFYAKDVLLPSGIQCRNLNTPLTTISPGKIIRGHLLVQKNTILNKLQKRNKPFFFYNNWNIQNKFFEVTCKKHNIYPWISTGYINYFIKRVAFRIESMKSLHKKQERLIVEIVTDGNISPRVVLQESRLCLTVKFIKLSDRVLPVTIKKKLQKRSFYNRFFKHSFYVNNLVKGFDQNINGFVNFREPLGFNLQQLDITYATFKELKNFGFANLGQILEVFIYEPNIFSPLLKKQLQQTFFQLGISVY
uniref:Alpha subunit of RNA polymerase n=1 Tax=Lepidodinium chlorophorum TaxID=107758 RepID=A0A0F7R0T9_LEPCH|nr:alpha subunit of RNA polymerase [Lepidodinium chlorophorum]BAR72305.1 alpha subunit of RNA polymerase [Lepidodinium chlorophorum]